MPNLNDFVRWLRRTKEEEDEEEDDHDSNNNDPSVVVSREGEVVCYLRGNDRTDTLLTEVGNLLRTTQRTMFHITFHGAKSFMATQKRWRILLEALNFHPSISHVTFEHNILSLPGLRTLIQQFQYQQFRYIKQLDIIYERLPVKDIITLFECLRSNNNTTTTNNNNTTTLECFQLRQSIVLRQSDTRLNSSLGQAIRRFLQENTTLRALDLSSNQFGTAIGMDVAIGLQANQSLVSLKYYGNNLQPEGAIAFAEALRYNQHLRCLDLGGNRMGDEGVIAICHTLHGTKTLTELSLCCNFITPRGVQELARAIRYNTSLQKLDYLYTRDCIRPACHEYIAAYKELINAFRYNTTLRYVEICYDWKIYYRDYKLQSTFYEMFHYNDTIIRFGKPSERFPDTTLEAIIDANQRGVRIAPKKGSRQRSDIYHWLLQQHPT